MLFSGQNLHILLVGLLSVVYTNAQIPPSWSGTFTPTLHLEATYPPSLRLSGNGGNLFTPEASHSPTFRLSDDSLLAPGTHYTVLLLDPDSPTRGGTGEEAYLHFLGTDYSLSLNVGADTRQLVSASRPRVEYEGPRAEEAGHRYVVLLYVQRGGEAKGAEGVVGRKGFQLERWERESGVGGAVAGLWFATAGGNRTVGMGKRDEVDDRMTGVGRGNLRKRVEEEGVGEMDGGEGEKKEFRFRPSENKKEFKFHPNKEYRFQPTRRDTRGVTERDEAWEIEAAGLGPRGERRSLITDINEVIRKGHRGLGSRSEEEGNFQDEINDAWKETVSGLGPRDEKQNKPYKKLSAVWGNSLAHVGKNNQKRDDHEPVKKFENAWKDTLAGLGPRNEKRDKLADQQKLKARWLAIPSRFGKKNHKRDPDNFLQELDESWKRTFGTVVPRSGKRQLAEEQMSSEWKAPTSSPQYSKRGSPEKRDEMWVKNVAGLGQRRKNRRARRPRG